MGALDEVAIIERLYDYMEGIVPMLMRVCWGKDVYLEIPELRLRFIVADIKRMSHDNPKYMMVDNLITHPDVLTMDICLDIAMNKFYIYLDTVVEANPSIS